MMLCAKLVEIGPVVWIKTFKSHQSTVFLLFLLSSLEKGRGPSFEQTWIPFTQGYFVPSLVEIDPVVLEKKMKMWKVYRQTDGQTDGQTHDGRQVIRKAHLSFQLRWAKKMKMWKVYRDINTDNEPSEKLTRSLLRWAL